MAKSKIKTPVTQFDPADMEREELTYDVKTRHDHYTEDTLGDPEGAAARADTKAKYPFWILNDFEASLTDSYNKSFNDGKEHLRPQESTIQSVYDTYIEGISSAKMVDGMTNLADPAVTDALVHSYTTILDSVGSANQFPIVASMGDITADALRKRAYAKHQYLTAFDKPIDADKPLPDWLETKQTRAMEAAAYAGSWYQAHRNIWEYLQWNNTPSYTYQARERITYMLHKNAADLDKRFREVEPVIATVSDYKQMAANF